jgi:inosose dehydratase
VIGASSTGPLLDSRLAAAPISWGVCEVPGWGAQLPPERVLSEAACLGLRATEAGPVGYLGEDLPGVVSVLELHGLQLVGGFLPVVLHDPREHEASIAAAHTWGSTLEAARAGYLISAVVVDLAWSPRARLLDRQWRAVFDGLARLDEAAAAHGLTHVLHPHWGTLVESRDDVSRVVDRSSALLCLDTGHLVLGGTDPVWLVDEARDRIAHVHLKDVADDVADRLRTGKSTLMEAVRAGLFRPLGAGDAPVADTVRTLEEAGYVGWYVLEQDRALTPEDASAEEGPAEDVRRSIEFIRSVVAGREFHVKEGVSR